MKEIKLTQNKVAFIDDKDYDLVSQYKWCAHKKHKNSKTYYAVASIWDATKKRCKTLPMHRLIMNAPPKQQVDHINGNGLDNRRENLRVCTNQQNSCNQHVAHSKYSYKGVDWCKNKKDNKKWRARIKYLYKEIHIGYFETEVEAAIAYNEAALKYFGEYARINEVEV